MNFGPGVCVSVLPDRPTTVESMDGFVCSLGLLDLITQYNGYTVELGPEACCDDFLVYWFTFPIHIPLLLMRHRTPCWYLASSGGPEYR